MSPTEAVCNKTMIIGMKTLISRYNKRCELLNAKVDATNNNNWDLFQEGEITFADLEKRYIKPKVLIKGNPGKMWVKRWKEKFKWSVRAPSAPPDYFAEECRA